MVIVWGTTCVLGINVLTNGAKVKEAPYRDQIHREIDRECLAGAFTQVPLLKRWPI